MRLITLSIYLRYMRILIAIQRPGPAEMSKSLRLSGYH